MSPCHAGYRIPLPWHRFPFGSCARPEQPWRARGTMGKAQFIAAFRFFALYAHGEAPRAPTQLLCPPPPCWVPMAEHPILPTEP